MKWMYVIFFIFTAVILGGSVYLISSRPGTDPQVILQEKKLEEALVFENSMKGWTKTIGYMKDYPVLVKSKELRVTFEGKVVSISATSLSLDGGDGKILKLDESNDLLSANVYVLPPKKDSYSNIALGDRVTVDVSVDFSTGKERILALYRLPK